MDIVLYIVIKIILASFLIAFVQSHRMLFKFRDKYPDVAKERLPCAFDNYADPEKFFFFYRRTNTEFLKGYPEIWNLRQQTKYCLFIGFGLSFAIFLIVTFMLFTAKLQGNLT
jgi:hypothetical protein